MAPRGRSCVSSLMLAGSLSIPRTGSRLVVKGSASLSGCGALLNCFRCCRGTTCRCAGPCGHPPGRVWRKDATSPSQSSICVFSRSVKTAALGSSLVEGLGGGALPRPAGRKLCPRRIFPPLVLFRDQCYPTFTFIFSTLSCFFPPFFLLFHSFSSFFSLSFIFSLFVVLFPSFSSFLFLIFSSFFILFLPFPPFSYFFLLFPPSLCSVFSLLAQAISSRKTPPPPSLPAVVVDPMGGSTAGCTGNGRS